MVVSDPAGLKERLHDRRADEGEAALTQVPADGVGERRRGRHFGPRSVFAALRLAVDEGPEIVRKRAELALDGE